MKPIQVKLKSKNIKSELPNYYVGMGEGAFFDLCKSQSDDLSFVSTSGLCGCISIAIYIKDGDKSYIFLNHIESDLPIKSVGEIISTVQSSIKESLPCFSFDDDFLKITVFVVGNQFRDLDGGIQQRRNSNDIGLEIINNLTERIGDNGGMCYFAHAKSVCFSIIGTEVNLFEIKNPTNDLVYFGPRHGGYGDAIDENSEPYENTCVDYSLSW